MHPRSLLVAAVISAGCAAAENAAEGTKSLATEAGQGVTDGSITFAVKAALIEDDTVESRQVNVDTRDGVVTLRGTQPTEQAKARAERIAGKARGVRRVVNELTVGPPPAE